MIDDKQCPLTGHIDPLDSATEVAIKGLSGAARIEKLVEIIVAYCYRARGKSAEKIDQIAAGHVDYLPAAFYEQEYNWVKENKEVGYAKYPQRGDLLKGTENLWIAYAQVVYLRIPNDRDCPLTRTKLLEPIVERWANTVNEEEAKGITSFLAGAVDSALSNEQQMTLKKALGMHEPNGWSQRRMQLLQALQKGRFSSVNEVHKGLAHALTRHLLDRPDTLGRILAIAEGEPAKS